MLYVSHWTFVYKGCASAGHRRRARTSAQRSAWTGGGDSVSAVARAYAISRASVICNTETSVVGRPARRAIWTRGPACGARTGVHVTRPSGARQLVARGRRTRPDRPPGLGRRRPRVRELRLICKEPAFDLTGSVNCRRDDEFGPSPSGNPATCRPVESRFHKSSGMNFRRARSRLVVSSGSIVKTCCIASGAPAAIPTHPLRTRRRCQSQAADSSCVEAGAS